MTWARIRKHRRAAFFVAVATGAAAVVWVLAGTPVPWQPPQASLRLSARRVDGSTVYRTNCAGCHGAFGEGEPDWKSQRGDGTYPSPPQDGTGHTWHHADGLLFRIVRQGGQYGAPAGFKSRMPAWGGALSDAEIVAVLEYIKTLWEPWEREAQAKVSIQDPYPP